MTEPLRLQADDPDVLSRTGEALTASQKVRPQLRFLCRQCGRQLAQVGDVPGYGPLFVSSWEVEPDGHAVVVNGRDLKGREKTRWLAENYEIVSESGKPVDEPLREAVVALLALPVGMVQDYPDLLTRGRSQHTIPTPSARAATT